ncbi:unnamed protein product [Amoebophrya sp. A25]|nr:unnamed protein product [Amoebophrya sp. A25]|eukprot:GSA25T00022311001.1
MSTSSNTCVCAYPESCFSLVQMNKIDRASSFSVRTTTSCTTSTTRTTSILGEPTCSCCTFDVVPMRATSANEAEQVRYFRQRGNELFKRKQFQDAIHFYTKAIEVVEHLLQHSNKTFPSCTSRGLDVLQHISNETFIPGCTSGLDNLAKLYTNRAGAYAALKYWIAAEKDARKAVEIRPDFVKGYYHLQRALLKQKKGEEALEVIEKLQQSSFLRRSRGGPSGAFDHEAEQLEQELLEESYREAKRLCNRSIDDYEIVEEIGTGNYTSIFVARWKRSGEEVALKVANKHRISLMKKTHELRRERHILERCRHENIIKLLDYFVDESQLYMVLDYCKGGDLQSMSRLCGLGIDMSRHYLAQVLAGLSYLHSKEIMHRDIKAENILVCQDTQLVKLIDGGFAKDLRNPLLDDVIDAPRVSFSSRSKSFVNYAGTPQFMAPECIRGSTSSASSFDSECWSFGCLVYQVVFGIPPFQAGSEYLVILRVMHNDLEFPSEVLYPEVNDLVRRCLKWNREERFTMTQIRNHAFFSGEFVQGVEGSVENRDPDAMAYLRRQQLRAGRLEDNNFPARINREPRPGRGSIISSACSSSSATSTCSLSLMYNDSSLLYNDHDSMIRTTTLLEDEHDRSFPSASGQLVAFSRQREQEAQEPHENFKYFVVCNKNDRKINLNDKRNISALSVKCLRAIREHRDENDLDHKEKNLNLLKRVRDDLLPAWKEKLREKMKTVQLLHRDTEKDAEKDVAEKASRVLSNEVDNYEDNYEASYYCHQRRTHEHDVVDVTGEDDNDVKRTHDVDVTEDDNDVVNNYSSTTMLLSKNSNFFLTTASSESDGLSNLINLVECFLTVWQWTQESRQGQLTAKLREFLELDAKKHEDEDHGSRNLMAERVAKKSRKIRRKQKRYMRGQHEKVQHKNNDSSAVPVLKEEVREGVELVDVDILIDDEAKNVELSDDVKEMLQDLDFFADDEPSSSCVDFHDVDEQRHLFNYMHQTENSVSDELEEFPASENDEDDEPYSSDDSDLSSDTSDEEGEKYKAHQVACSRYGEPTNEIVGSIEREFC